MRSLGDMRWLNEYIGLPYRFGGRQKDGVDCYGLAKLIYREQYGIILPDWLTDEFDLKGRDAMIAAVVTSGEFTEVEQPQDGDFVVCYRTRAAHHLGLYFAGGVLHTQSGAGAIYEPLPRFREKFTKVVFGEWKP